MSTNPPLQETSGRDQASSAPFNETDVSVAAVSSPRKGPRFYRPELDVLRFTAFLLVFVSHYPHYPDNRVFATLLGMGRVGLLLFFVLSAYLITGLLLRERETTGKIHVAAFFVRRILRIWPLYFLVISLAFCCKPLFPHIPLSPRAIPYLFLLAANFFIARHGWLLGLIGPLWSLSIEEQFYLVIPSVMRSFGIVGLRNLALVAIAVAYITLAALAHHPAVPLASTHDTSPIDLPWINSFVQFQFFAAGTLVAILLYKRRWVISPLARLSLLFGGPALIFLVDLTLHPSQPGIPGLHLCAGYLGLLLGTVAIFLAFLNASIRPPQALVYLGRISYGLYVFHFFAINFGILAYKRLQRAGVPVSFLLLVEPTILLVTIAAAATSYRFFEQPILRLKERFAYVRTVA